MPIPGAFIGNGDWRKSTLSLPIASGMNFAVGDFIVVIIDFLIVSLVVFIIVKNAKKS